MKTQLKWRLSKLPTPSELVELVNNKLVTQEEAKTILFDQITKEDIDVEALKKEIEFLRRVVDRLSDSRTGTTTVIEREIVPYKKYPWYSPYEIWCSGTSSAYATTTASSGSGVTYLNATSATNTSGSNLADLKTF